MGCCKDKVTPVRVIMMKKYVWDFTYAVIMKYSEEESSIRYNAYGLNIWLYSKSADKKFDWDNPVLRDARDIQGCGICIERIKLMNSLRAEAISSGWIKHITLVAHNDFNEIIENDRIVIVGTNFSDKNINLSETQYVLASDKSLMTRKLFSSRVVLVYDNLEELSNDLKKYLVSLNIQLDFIKINGDLLSTAISNESCDNRTVTVI